MTINKDIAEEMLADINAAMKSELRKLGFKGSKGILQRDLPEAVQAIFFQRDRISDDDARTGTIRFQFIWCIYLKVLNDFFRVGRKSANFCTADADRSGVLGEMPESGPYLWWIVRPDLSVEDTKSELLGLLRTLMPTIDIYSTASDYYERGADFFRSGERLGVNSLLGLAVVGKSLGKIEESNAVRDYLLDNSTDDNASYIQNKITQLDHAGFLRQSE